MKRRYSSSATCRVVIICECSDSVYFLTWNGGCILCSSLVRLDLILWPLMKFDNFYSLIQCILVNLKYGMYFAELSNEIGSKSLTFNEDLESRPWWTPTPEENYLLGQLIFILFSSNLLFILQKLLSRASWLCICFPFNLQRYPLSFWIR